MYRSMMKKLLFFAAALVMAACGNKTGSIASDADSTVQDSVLTSDTEADLQKAVEGVQEGEVTAAPEEGRTEKSHDASGSILTQMEKYIQK